MGLYQLFTHDDAGTAAMRRAVYQMWQHAPADRRRTMRLLSGAETDLMKFNGAFLKVMAVAIWQILQGRAGRGPLLDTGRALRSFGEWLSWLVAGNLPLLIRVRSVPSTGAPLERVHRAGQAEGEALAYDCSAATA